MSTDAATETDGADPGSITPKQMRHLNVLLARAGLREREPALDWITQTLGDGPVTSRKELSRNDATALIDRLIDDDGRRDPATVVDAAPVQEVIRRVMAEIGQKGVAKGGFNRDQNYSFRSVEDVVNALSPILSKHGLVIIPTVLDVQISDRPTKSGGSQMVAVLTVDYEFIGPAGDSKHASVVGTGMDTSDKATNKALSAAFKYAVGQVLAIPSVGWTEGDSESPQYAAPAQENPNAELLKRIGEYSKRANRSVEDFTAKFRQRNGNITVAQMADAPQSLLYGFVRNVEEFYQQEQEAPPPGPER